MKKIFKKLLNKETLSYLLFGLLTTIVNYSAFMSIFILCNKSNALISNLVAFIIATIFAYITNKIWVFKSNIWSLDILKLEIITFLSARIFSFLLEQVGLFMCINVLKIENYSFLGINGVIVAKIVLSFIVVIINYGLSKLFIFKKID